MGVQVDKIFGPGNQYVTAAKMALQNSEAMVAIDMPAGPSEVLVIADAGAPPAHVAADLLSQAEHGPDSQVGSCGSCGMCLAARFPAQLCSAVKSVLAARRMAPGRCWLWQPMLRCLGMTRERCRQS